MIKRILALLLTVVILMSMTSYNIAAEDTPTTSFDFMDMPNDWSTEALERAVSNGLINGHNNRIMPKDNLTRAQMGTIINRAFGAEGMDDLAGYRDVASSAWYYTDMRKAVYMGTFKGSDGLLNPNSMVTRQEVIVALARVLKLTGSDQSILDLYVDKNDISQWAKDAVASMVTYGYITGSNGRINPKNNITRAEFAKLMDNLVKTYISDTNTYSANLYGNVVVNAPNVVLENMTINGDLIIADGVGNEEIDLMNVVVAGRTVIRGGGTNTIRISGNSRLGNIVIARVGDKVRLKVEAPASVGTVTIDGTDDVILEGNYGRVIVKSPNMTLIAQKSFIQNLVVEADQVVVQTNALALVNKISTTGLITQIVTKSGSEIDEIMVYRSGARINGSGKVLSVVAEAADVKVTTANTVVSAGIQATNVYLGNALVEPGSATGVVDIPNTTLPAGSPEGITTGGTASSKVLIESMTINSSGSAITNHQGSMAMAVTTVPSVVSNSEVIWDVTNGVGSELGAANINSEGLLTAVANGTVLVQATTTDGTEITASKTINISGQLSNINTLSAIKLSGNSMDGFNALNDTYAITLEYGATRPTVIGIPADDKATVLVSNASNINSSTETDRTTTIKVTAQDGVSTKEYKIVFNVEEAKTEARLKDLQVDGATIIGFSEDTLTYTVTLPKLSTTTPKVTPVLMDVTASLQLEEAIDVSSDNITERTTSVTVTAENGLVKKTYVIVFDVTPNDSATLKDIKVDDVTLVEFDPAKVTYFYNLPKFTFVAPDVQGTLTDANARVNISKAVDVNSNEIEQRTTSLEVVAENGIDYKTYNIIFDVTPLDTDATLKGIYVDGQLIADFDKDDLSYQYPALEPFSTVTPSVTAVSNYGGARILVDPALDVTSSIDSKRTTTVSVTAEDGVTSKEYTIEFNVTPPSRVNTLSDLRFNGIQVDGFASYTENYDEVLPYGTTENPTVTATKVDANSTVFITQVIDITSSDEILRTATVKVTAEDRSSTKTYTIKFEVAPPPLSKIATVTNITYDGTYVPAFSPEEDEYTVTLPVGTRTVPFVAGTLTDSKAKIVVTQAINIMSTTESERTATIFVTAEDGITTRQYKILFNVTLSSDARLSDLTVDGVTINTFSASKLTYSATLSPGTTATPEVVGVPVDSNADIVYRKASNVLSGIEDERTTIVTVTSEDGNTEKAYSIVFIVTVLSDDATLSDLTIGGITVDGFNQNDYSYTQVLPYGSTVVPLVQGIVSDALASKVVTQASGVNGTARITVTAEDGTVLVYEVIFEIAKNDDANLASLFVEGVEIDDFDPLDLEYNYGLDPDETSPAAISVVLSDVGGAEYNIKDALDVTSSTESERTTTITVSAEDRDVVKIYKVIFYFK